MDDENLFRASSRIPSYDPWEDEQEIIFSGEGDTDTRAISGYTGVSFPDAGQMEMIILGSSLLIPPLFCLTVAMSPKTDMASSSPVRRNAPS